jgi:hypothetical protein
MRIIYQQPALRKLLLNTLRLLGEGKWGDMPEKIAAQGAKSFVLTFSVDSPVLLDFRFEDGTHCQFNPLYPGDAIVVKIMEIWGLDDAQMQGFSVYADEGGPVRWMGYGIVVVPDKKV